eukprot:Phypoly_transcript_11660.p1 GENE.Phypoly_transcript_11660~~Phypoly_transcript_11660.p1  ORF type:complete len:183 (+),score=19.29 Phypoly_transcript_11660:197-745(+)
MPMSHKIEVGASPIHGQGWRAKEDIVQGEVLWVEGPDDDKVFTHHEDEVDQWPQEARDRFYSLSYQIDEKVHRSPYGRDAVAPRDVLLSYFINHCCDGNMWYEDAGSKLVASRNIAQGEEINYDYALTETNPQWVLHCRCNKSLCRGVITGTDYKDKALQTRYGTHFLPYVLEKIEAEKSVI